MWNNCPPDPVLDTAYWGVSCPAHFLLLHFMLYFWRPRISWWSHSIRQIYPYFFTKVTKLETRREEIYCSFRKRVTPRLSELLLSKIPVYWWEAGFQYDTLMNEIMCTFTLHLISYIFIYRPIYTLLNLQCSLPFRVQNQNFRCMFISPSMLHASRISSSLI
jgi:hypothetical protein